MLQIRTSLETLENIFRDWNPPRIWKLKLFLYNDSLELAVQFLFAKLLNFEYIRKRRKSLTKSEFLSFNSNIIYNPFTSKNTYMLLEMKTVYINIYVFFFNLRELFFYLKWCNML